MRVKSMSAIGFAAVLAAGPALAEEKPLADKTETVESAVATPVEDLGIKKDKIPEILIKAQKDPYNVGDAPNCAAIAAEVAELNRELGEDYDEKIVAGKPNETPKGPQAADLLKAGVATAIPFRSVVRQLSGAAAHEKAVDAAIDAGLTRRGYLKGRALEMNCPAGAAPVWFAPRPELPPAEHVSAAIERNVTAPVETATSAVPPAAPTDVAETAPSAPVALPPPVEHRAPAGL